jgi:hypothetical protein
MKLDVPSEWSFRESRARRADGSRAATLVRLDGAPYDTSVLSLACTPDRHAAGDLVWVAGWPLVLDAPAPLALRRDPSTPDLLWFDDGGAERLACVQIGDDGAVPLAARSREAASSVRSVRLSACSPDAASWLETLDLARVVVVFQDARTLPKLPHELRYLWLCEPWARALSGSLSHLTQLRLLVIEGQEAIAQLDAQALSELSELRLLQLSSLQLVHPEALARLRQLRGLYLSGCFELQQVDCVAELPQLVELDVRSTDIADLSPLAGLARLQRVRADGAPIARLPQTQLPALTTLGLLDAPLSAEALAEFAGRNPRCQLLTHPDAALQAAFRDARRVRIRIGPPGLRRGTDAPILADLEAALLPHQLFASLHASPKQAGTEFCRSDVSLELYTAEDRLLATLGVVHGASLRWPDVWPRDVPLAKGDDERLCAWLAEQGAAQPLADLRAAELCERVRVRKRALATRGFSGALEAAFTESDAAFTAELERSYPELGARLGVLFQVLGASSGSWTVLEGREIAVDKLLAAAPVAPLAEACQSALLGEDRVRRRGAARFWTGWKSPLEAFAFEDPVRLWRVVLDAQQAARYQPLRVQAAARLATAALIDVLPRAERAERLLSLMRDPDADVRRRAMLAAAISDCTAALPRLMDVLAGKPSEIEPLSPVPEDEAEVVNSGGEVVCAGCPEQEVAALSLAYLAYRPAQALVAALAPTPMRDVALALFGDASRLRPEHFGMGRAPRETGNQQLQLAAVEAVARCHGRVGLAWALAYQQVSHWWEKERVAAKLAAMLREQDAPESAALVGCTSLKLLAEWFERHGDAYLSRRT